MDTLDICLHQDSQNPAIIITGKKSNTTISHAALYENVVKLQEQLRRTGLHGGQRIALIIPNPYLFTVTFLAIILEANIAGPLNHNMKSAEYESFLQDFKADLVVIADDSSSTSSPISQAAGSVGVPIATVSVSGGEVAMKLPDGPFRSKEIGLQGDTVAMILHTSGTTGKPKAVPLSHGNLTDSISNIRRHYDFTVEDRTSIIMPLFHIHGIVCALLTPLSVGSAVIVPENTSGLTPSFLQDAVTHGVTWFTATPTLHRLILKLPGPIPKLKFVRSCSSPLDAGLLSLIEDKLQCVVIEAYAMTEAAHQVCSNPPGSARRPGSVGVPTGVDVQIMDETGSQLEVGQVGEVCIRGKNVMNGYLDNAEANQKSFFGEWFRTGDVGKFDDGHLVLTGRIKELINKGGEKIGPVEVDAVINRHPDVGEAVTFAMPDEMYGEEVAAAVVVEEGKTLTEKDLKTWVGQYLAPQKVPKRIYFVDKIPKTAVGKMQRSLVAKTLLQE